MNQALSEIYDLLRDMGSLIAGTLALIAGVMAYRSGLIQAQATEDAAKRQVAATEAANREQVAALERQLEHARSVQDDRDERIRHALLSALSMEAARVKMLAEARMATPYSIPNTDPLNRLAIARAYLIEPTIEIRHNTDLDALVSKETGIAARELVARLDQLNAQIMLKTTTSALRAGELDAALTQLAQAADALQQAVALDRDISG